MCNTTVIYPDGYNEDDNAYLQTITGFVTYNINTLCKHAKNMCNNTWTTTIEVQQAKSLGRFNLRNKRNQVPHMEDCSEKKYSQKANGDVLS